MTGRSILDGLNTASKRYFESKGGYEKVLERAGLVAPP